MTLTFGDQTAQVAGSAQEVLASALLKRLGITAFSLIMKGRPWVRHDEHYHVDFALPCKPALTGS